MSEKAHRHGASARRMLAAAAIAPLLVGIAACAPPEAGAGDASSEQAGQPEDRPSALPEASAGSDEPTSDPLEGLGSAALLTLGLRGEAVIMCDFANETTSGTIYFALPERMRFDGKAQNGALAHILLYEGQAHAWAEGQTQGSRYPRPEDSYLVADEAATVTSSSTNCVPYTGPSSIFELPSGVTFVDLPVE